jgi:hypothetical protein
VHGKVRQRRGQAALRLSAREEEALRAERLAQDQGVRRYLEQRLRQVSENCRQAWQRVYEQDDGLATDLRTRCARQYAELAEQIREADYRTGRYFGEHKPPLEDLIQMLTLDQQVLQMAQEMVDLSQHLYDAVVARDLPTVKGLAVQMDQGCRAIANRFAEREQFLGC